MKKTINQCVCGNKALHVIHAVPSGRVFIICPNCYRKTKIKANEQKAWQAWEVGEIIESEEIR